MQTYEQLVTKAFGAAEEKARAALRGKHEKWMRDQLKARLDAVPKARDGLLELIKFCSSCKLKVGKPKVLRTSGPSGFCFEHLGRCVKPDLVLHVPGKSVRIKDPADVEPFYVETDWDRHDREFEVRKPCLPQISADIVGVSRYAYETEVKAYLPSIIAAFGRDVGDSWHTVARDVRAHVAEVEASLGEIVSGHFAAKGAKERAAFREKFSECLKETERLIDARPESVLEVFRLGWDEASALAEFSKRNRADVELVSLDDIVEAQNLARTKSVMES